MKETLWPPPARKRPPWSHSLSHGNGEFEESCWDPQPRPRSWPRPQGTAQVSEQLLKQAAQCGEVWGSAAALAKGANHPQELWLKDSGPLLKRPVRMGRMFPSLTAFLRAPALSRDRRAEEGMRTTEKVNRRSFAWPGWDPLGFSHRPMERATSQGTRGDAATWKRGQAEFQRTDCGKNEPESREEWAG